MHANLSTILRLLEPPRHEKISSCWIVIVMMSTLLHRPDYCMLPVNAQATLDLYLSDLMMIFKIQNTHDQFCRSISFKFCLISQFQKAYSIQKHSRIQAQKQSQIISTMKFIATTLSFLLAAATAPSAVMGNRATVFESAASESSKSSKEKSASVSTPGSSAGRTTEQTGQGCGCVIQ